MIIALINSKGGVAKTTTAVNLGAALAQAGQRVLVCDLDSQGSASFSLGVQRSDLEPSLASALLDDQPIADLVRSTAIAGLDLISASMALANFDLAFSDVAGRERRLQSVLEPLRANYDFILLDCPPSLALLPVNALVACDGFIVPVTPHYLALEGLVNLTSAVDKMRAAGLEGGCLLGIVLTQVDYRSKATGEIVEMIRDQFGPLVFASEVRGNVRLCEAPSFGQSVLTYAPSSPGANAYRFLAGEVLGRVGQKKAKKEENKEGKKSKNKKGKK